jgi:hypothetical protein
LRWNSRGSAKYPETNYPNWPGEWRIPQTPPKFKDYERKFTVVFMANSHAALGAFV